MGCESSCVPRGMHRLLVFVLCVRVRVRVYGRTRRVARRAKVAEAVVQVCASEPCQPADSSNQPNAGLSFGERSHSERSGLPAKKGARISACCLRRELELVLQQRCCSQDGARGAGRWCREDEAGCRNARMESARMIGFDAG